MKPHAALGVVLLSLLVTGTFPVHAARAPLLRYRPCEGRTNVYNLQFELRGESGTDVIAGNLIVIGKPGPSNVITLSLRGTLVPKRDGNPRPPTMMGSPGYPRWSMPITINENELQFDGQGRLLRAVGDWPLPFPLGSVAQALVERLPAKAESRWETEDELAMIDDPLNLGPGSLFAGLPPNYSSYSFYGGPYGSRPGNAILAVTRKTRYEIKSSEVGLTTVSKHLNLDSHLMAGAEPRIAATGEGEFVFDTNLGQLASASLEAKGVVNTDTVTRRSATTLRLKLLDGTERENALRPMTTQTLSGGTPPKKLTREEIDKLAADLKSDDATTRMTAANKLQTAELSEAPASLLEFLTEKAGESDSSLRYAAIKIIGDYGTKDQVPTLLQWLKSDDSFSRNAAVRGLGRLKEKSAAEPLAAMLATGGSDGYQAVEALTKLGPDAEDAVLPLLQEKHVETRRQVCNVLKQIGTKKSLEPLRELMLNKDRQVNEAAAEAVRAIAARQ